MKCVLIILCLISLTLGSKLYKVPINPSEPEAKASAETKKWALEQTQAARNLFYSPKANFSAELAKLSTNLVKLTNTLDLTWKEYRVVHVGS
jgi:hypothetical protein